MSGLKWIIYRRGPVNADFIQLRSDPLEPLTTILFVPEVFLTDRTNRSSEIAF
jgi:hypothetical protein